jgi:ribosomal protein S18 acetylase RimI-like enzyme
VSDERLDALAETARNRGLKLVRSRVRTPGKRRFGKVGLTDKGGKAVFGMDSKGPVAKPEEVEDYLRNLGAKDWGASLDVAVLPRKPARSRAEGRKRDSGRPPTGSAEVVQLRPKAEPSKPKPKVKPPPPLPSPRLRPARPADARRLAALFDYLGHPLGEKAVRRNLAALAKRKETPLVVELGKEVVGLAGIHVMVTAHREAPVGRIPVLVVAEEAQGRGLGRMLVEEAERLLKKAGCAIVEVTSNDRRPQAHAFYRHMGYERTSIRFMKILPGTGRGTT